MYEDENMSREDWNKERYIERQIRNGKLRICEHCDEPFEPEWGQGDLCEKCQDDYEQEML